MRRARLRFPGSTPSPVTSARSEEVRDLTAAVNNLSDKLDLTVTRDEVAEELEERMQRLELGQAAVLQGAKQQIRRTRMAGWLILGFATVLLGILVIQAHDAHITYCMLTPIDNPVQAYVCNAAFPLHDHDAYGHLLGIHHTAYEFAIPPQLVGALLFVSLVVGLVLSFRLYRRRSSQEGRLEAARPPQDTLAQMTAAQGVAVQQSREDTQDHDRRIADE